MEIVNRVQQSGILVYNLSSLWDGAPVVELDLAPFLEAGLVLREKNFRRMVNEHAWARYAGKHVALCCTTDAIVPTWAYLLIASRLGQARSVAAGRRADAVDTYFARALEQEDWSRFQNRIVVIKGCGSDVVPRSAYVTAMRKLMPIARKVMYGEPCSAVPLYRR